MSLEQRLSEEAVEVEAIAFAHTGVLTDRLAPLTRFARDTQQRQYIRIDVACRFRQAWPMKPKSAQLQIRVSVDQKARIQRLARNAGMDMSTYVLNAVLASPAARFAECVDACGVAESANYALAELNSLLTSLSAPELRDAIAATPAARLTPYVANYVAAMVEYACQKRGLAVPAWVRAVEPLAEPVFATGLQSLRLHLLTHSPPPFRRRNIFIDSSLGDRV